MQEGEDQVERSPTLMGRPPPYKRRGTSLPGGGAQGGKGMTSAVRSFISEDQEELHDQRYN